MGAVAPEISPSANAAKLMKQSLVWDNHGCMPLRADDFDFLPQLDRYKRSGVDIASMNVGYDAVPWENTLLVIAHFRSWVRQRFDQYILVETVSDIDVARNTDRLGICFDIEGGSATGSNLWRSLSMEANSHRSHTTRSSSGVRDTPMKSATRDTVFWRSILISL